MKKFYVLYIVLFALLLSFSVSAQNFGSGCVYKPEIDGKVPIRPRLETRDYKVLPHSCSLKKYCPRPKSQSDYNTCTSWAAIYAARTICEAIANGWTNTDSITSEAFAPLFIYKQVANSHGCTEGTSIGESLRLMMELGVPKMRLFDVLCDDDVPKTLFAEALDYKIDGYSVMFNDYCEEGFNKVQLTKKALSQNHPVIISMMRYMSLNTAGALWNGLMDSQLGYHSMCVVGYDDEKYGGAFEVMNSWGTDWGEGGFTWIKYDDYNRVARYAYDIYLGKKIEGGSGEVISMSGAMRMVGRDGGIAMSLKLDTIGELVHYYTDDDYMSGKKFRLSVECSEPAWVYVIASDLYENHQVLFPYSEMVSAHLDYTDSHIALPDETHEFKLDKNVGTDYFCGVYSHDELDINDIVRRMGMAEGSFYKKLKTVLGGAMVLPNEINYDSKEVGFKSLSTRMVVPLIVELSHRDINE